MLEKDIITKGRYDYELNYSFVGHGIDAQAIYAVLETKYSISKGVVYDRKWTGKYVDINKNEYTSKFIR